MNPSPLPRGVPLAEAPTICRVADPVRVRRLARAAPRTGVPMAGVTGIQALARRLLRAALPALALAAAASAGAQDRADIDRTQIIGNRELPKVLYIVPWKKPLPGELSGRPVHSVLDEVLAPVDREVFRRQVDYSTQIQARADAKPAAAPATAPNPVKPTAPEGTPR
jgi:hypothetical protein